MELIHPVPLLDEPTVGLSAPHNTVYLFSNYFFYHFYSAHMPNHVAALTLSYCRPAAHFHHVIELLRFRQGTLSGIFLSAGENLCLMDAAYSLWLCHMG